MVGAGMAWAFLRYSHDYVVQEGEAQAANLGIHAHHCQPAWEWRRTGATTDTKCDSAITLDVIVGSRTT